MKKSIPTQFVQIERRSKLSRDELDEFFSYLEKQVLQSPQTEKIPIGKLSGKIANSFLTPKDAPVPDCLTCGVCCSALYYVQATKEDQTASENFWEITIQGQNGAIIVDRILRRNSETGRCMALEGELGKSIGCKIYEQRPQLCRAFDVGSDKCHALRRRFGIEPPLSQIETATALLKILDRDEPESLARRIFHSEISENSETNLCEIKVWLEDDEELVIHQFDLQKEQWLEGEFTGLTLAKAQNLVKNKSE